MPYNETAMNYLNYLYKHVSPEDKLKIEQLIQTKDTIIQSFTIWPTHIEIKFETTSLTWSATIPPLVVKRFSLEVVCHCGAKAVHSEHSPYMDGYCQDCTDARCDAYPGECPRNSYPYPDQI